MFQKYGEKRAGEGKRRNLLEPHDYDAADVQVRHVYSFEIIIQPSFEHIHSLGHSRNSKGISGMMSTSFERLKGTSMLTLIIRHC